MSRLAPTLLLGLYSAVSWTMLIGCGARTGLREPCVIQLERERPSIVVITDRGASTGLILRSGENLYARQRSMVGAMLAPLEDIADVGLVANPPPRFGAQSCTASVPVTVAIGSRARTRILEGIDSVVRDLPMTASSALQPAYRAATDALASTGNPNRRFVFLFHLGYQCNNEQEAQAVDLIRASTAKTLVIGLMDPAVWAFQESERLVANFSEAGRLAIRSGRLAYYRIDELDGVNETIRREVVRPYYCDLRLTKRLPTSSYHWTVHTSAGPLPQATDGGLSQWTVGESRVRILGTACDFLVETRAEARLVESGSNCAPTQYRL